MSKIQIFCQVKEWLGGISLLSYPCFYQGVLCAVNSVTEETSPPEVIADKSAKDIARAQGGDSPFCLILSRLEGQRQRI